METEMEWRSASWHGPRIKVYKLNVGKKTDNTGQPLSCYQNKGELP